MQRNYHDWLQARLRGHAYHCLVLAGVVLTAQLPLVKAGVSSVASSLLSCDPASFFVPCTQSISSTVFFQLGYSTCKAPVTAEQSAGDCS